MSESPVMSDEESPGQALSAPGVRGALGRYRVMAYVVGVGLLALCAAIVLKYGFDREQYSTVIGPVHGFLYVVYILATVDLGLKARWSIKGVLLVLLAGMIPFVSFITERRVTHKVQQGEAL